MLSGLQGRSILCNEQCNLFSLPELHRNRNNVFSGHYIKFFIDFNCRTFGKFSRSLVYNNCQIRRKKKSHTDVSSAKLKNNPDCSSGDKFESLYIFSLIESISMLVSKLFTAILNFKIIVL